MTTEQKAIAYDKAIERAREWYNKPNSSSIGKAYLYAVFPELKESENDRIRKIIRGWIYTRPASFFDNGISKEEILAWLENQGKNNSCKFTFEDVLALECSMKTAKITKGGDELYKILVPLYNKIHDAYLIEKQGEQKETLCDKCKKEQSSHSCQDITALGRCYIDGMNTADKIKPKFKVGDWVVNNINKDIFLIKSVNSGYCTLEDTKGNIYSPCLPFESEFHLWTIDDAKDGDVLWHSDSASNGIFIFKEIRHDGKVLCYCDYDSEDHFCTGEYHTCCWSYDKYIQPATKKQRDHLFEKMKEAGYEWNEEKNELKKIGQKLAWSDKDEFRLDRICKFLWKNRKGDTNEIYQQVQDIDWLKSFKERITNGKEN